MRLLGAREDSNPLSLCSWTGSSESTETLGDDMVLNRGSKDKKRNVLNITGLDYWESEMVL